MTKSVGGWKKWKIEHFSAKFSYLGHEGGAGLSTLNILQNVQNPLQFHNMQISCTNTNFAGNLWRHVRVLETMKTLDNVCNRRVFLWQTKLALLTTAKWAKLLTWFECILWSGRWPAKKENSKGRANKTTGWNNGKSRVKKLNLFLSPE